MGIADPSLGLRSGPAKAIKRFLPPPILNCARALWRLSWLGRWIYCRCQLLRRLNPGPQPPRDVGLLRSVLFVCHGNVIRSPMAAALFQKRLPESELHRISVSSAGLHAVPGRPMDGRALIVAKDFGVSLETHVACPLTAQMADAADMIFVMDALNEAELLERLPEAEDKVFLLGSCAKDRGYRGGEILDPYQGDESDIRQCYEEIQSSILGLISTFFPSESEETHSLTLTQRINA